MKRNNFIIYTTFYEPISSLSDKQLGRLFRAIFKYNLGEVVSVEEDIRMAYAFFVNQFRIDEGKYQAKIERDTENGRKGGNPNFRKGQPNPYYKKAEEVPKDNPTLPKITQDNPIKEKEKDNVNVLKENSKKKLEFDLSFLPEDFKEVVEEWLAYKKAIKDCYKTQRGVELCYKKLRTLSNGSPEVARQVIEQSMANNWKGLFEVKQNQYGRNYDKLGKAFVTEDKDIPLEEQTFG